METRLPLVSVIIPAYNAAVFIERTLLSVLAQTYRHIEVLVVDDGSQDETASLVEAIARQDSRVMLLKQTNKGVAAARNLAIWHSQGEFVAPIDADDLWFPEKLQKQVDCILESPNAGLVYTWSAFIDEDDYFTGGYSADRLEGEVYWDLIHYNFVGNASTPLIRRSCLEKVGYYNCQLRELNAQGCEDWDLYLRIAEAYPIRVVPEFLVGYRQVLTSMSTNYAVMAKSFHLVLDTIRQQHSDLPETIYRNAKRNFYSYLGALSYRSGNHQSVILWLRETIKLDLQDLQPNAESLLRLYKLYKLLLISNIKVKIQPVSTIIWRDHYSWMRFRRWFGFKLPKEKIAIKHYLPSTLLPKNLESNVHTQKLASDLTASSLDFISTQSELTQARTRSHVFQSS